MANVKNLASGTIAESITASATTVLVYVGDGGASTIKAVWPTAPFYVTVMPSSPVAGVANSMDSEVMLVSAVGTDQVGNVSLTVTRAQKNTSAKAFSAGAVVTNGIYVDDILDRFYPVGSIFMSATLSTASAVGEALGGTWEAWGAGRVPVGVDATQTEFDTVEETGGEKTHTLTTSEIPSHTHSAGSNSDGFASHATSGTSFSAGFTNNNSGEMFRYRQPASTGGGGAHNNLQPYITCYMYKRTA